MAVLRRTRRQLRVRKLRGRRLAGAVAVLAAAGTALGTGPAFAHTPAPQVHAVSWVMPPTTDPTTTQYVLWRSWDVPVSGPALDQASRIGGTWRGEPPGLALPAAATPAVAADPSSGELFVVWRGRANGLNEATDINRAWTQRSLGLPMGAGGTTPTIAADDTAHAFVTWATATGEIMVASNATGPWTVADTGVNEGPDASAPSIGVDPVTDVRVVVWRRADGALMQARDTESPDAPSFDAAPAWSVADLGIPTGNPLAAPAVAITATGTRDVVWRNGTSHLQEAIKPAAQSWHSQVLTIEIGAQASAPALAVNAAGAQYVVWEGASGQLYEAGNVTGTWEASTPGEDIGSGNSAPTIAVVTAPAATLESRIVNTAESQIGYADPKKADNVFCNKYTAADGEGYACNVRGTRWEEWCADFAKWVWAKSGAEVDANLTPSAASFRLWAIANHRWHSFKSGYVPQPGDAVVYGLDSSGTWAAHVAIVVASSDGLPDVVNGDFNVSVSPVYPMEIDEDVSSFNDIGGYASPMPAGSAHAQVVTRHLAVGVAAGLR